MKKLLIDVLLESDTLIGSGEGFGAVIDSDIVMDEVGLPYIPAKRMKGCLRDAAIGVVDIFNKSGVTIQAISTDTIKTVFGIGGQIESAPVSFSNLEIEEYSNNKSWLDYFIKNYGALVSPETITDTFTSVYQQTAIDENGVAKDHSLRVIRVVDKGTRFVGEIIVNDDQVNYKDVKKLLSYACSNLRHIGTKRNRGFGEVKCCLIENGKPVDFIQEVEQACIA